jgi:hypothetical protein
LSTGRQMQRVPVVVVGTHGIFIRVQIQPKIFLKQVPKIIQIIQISLCVLERGQK